MLSSLRNRTNRPALYLAFFILTIIFAVPIAYGAWPLVMLCLYLFFIPVVESLANKKRNSGAVGREGSN